MSGRDGHERGRRGRGGWQRGHHRDYRQKHEFPRDEQHEKGEEVDESAPIVQTFRAYQRELDGGYDKYERLVKKSRDVTIESKRIIFHLHRITGSQNKEKILFDVGNQLKQVQENLLKGIALEVKDEDFYHYLRAYSPGLQEYIEAVTFYNYIKNERLISLEEVQKDLVFTKIGNDDADDNDNEDQKEESLTLTVPPLDYILGVADLTGELMRKGITAVGQGNLEEPFQLCQFLQNIYDAFLIIGHVSGRELYRKIQVLKSSLQKVENACYTLRVRGSEIPKHMLIDVFSAKSTNESFGTEAMEYNS